MKKSGIEIYRNITKNKNVHVPEQIQFQFSYDYSPKIDLKGNNPKSERNLKFIDSTTSECVHESTLKPGHFTSLFRKWFTPWLVEGYDRENKVWSLDFESTLFGGKILISIDSSSLGDTIAWLPVIDQLRKKYKAQLIVTTFWNEIMSHFFPQIKFSHPGFRDPSANAVFGVGWYEEDDRNIHRRDPRSISLQQVAGDLIGVEVNSDILPSQIPGWLETTKSRFEGKYVCIGTESTANAKHWHYPGGWQTLVNYLKSIGYEVVVIHSQQNTLDGVIDKTGTIDMTDRMIDLYHADFFVGIGSGLSWLAWALRKPVVMISGFSSPHCEFSHLNYRVINSDVCHGCFNDVRHKFDRGDWNWCPGLKNTERMFECTTKITPDMVISKIQNLISEQKL